jgi:glycosyltransferase involved in cell wall biosynthesis
MNQRVYQTIDRFSQYASQNVIVTIIHQITDEGDYILAPLKENVRYFNCPSVGLPQSRNYGLNNAIGDFIIPTDDDVTFVNDFFDIVSKSIATHPDADGFSYKIKAEDSKEEFKHYPHQSFKHNSLSLAKVSSIELCISRRFLNDQCLQWDEDFGLGTTFPGGLEVVFLQDCFRKKISLYYEPVYLVLHPLESSGKVVSKGKISLRASIFIRSFGWLKGLVFIFAFYAKKRKMFAEKGIGFFQYNLSSYKGIKEFYLWSKNC